MNTEKSLETRLLDLIYEVRLEDGYINDTFTSIVYLMKKVVEDEGYKLQLYEIGNKENLVLTSEDSIDVYFNKLTKIHEKKFGLENSLKYVLWDSQVEERYFDRLFNGIVVIMKEISENIDYKTQLYKINLSVYKDEEE